MARSHMVFQVSEGLAKAFHSAKISILLSHLNPCEAVQPNASILDMANDLMRFHKMLATRSSRYSNVSSNGSSLGRNWKDLRYLRSTELCKSKPNTEPRRTKRQRHNQSIAPCHGDKNKLKSSSTEALINYIPQQKARLHSCLRRQGLQLVRVTHCRSFFIWPDLPNVCGFFKQTRGSV